MNINSEKCSNSNCRRIIKTGNKKVCRQCLILQDLGFQNIKKQINEQFQMKHQNSKGKMQEFINAVKHDCIDQAEQIKTNQYKQLLAHLIEENKRQIEELKYKVDDQKILNSVLRQKTTFQSGALASLRDKVSKAKEHLNSIMQRYRKKQAQFIQQSFFLYDSIYSSHELSFLSDEVEEHILDYNDDDQDKNYTVFILGDGYQMQEELTQQEGLTTYLKFKRDIVEGISEEHAHNQEISLSNSVMFIYRIQQCFNLALPYPIYIDQQGFPQMTALELYKVFPDKQVIFCETGLTELYMNIKFISYSIGFRKRGTKYFDLKALLQLCLMKISGVETNQELEPFITQEKDIIKKIMTPATTRVHKFILNVVGLSQIKRVISSQESDDEFYFLE